MCDIKTGDRVAYSAKFCKAVCDHTVIPHWRGEAIDVKDLSIGRTVVTVKWDHQDEPKNIVNTNLCKPGGKGYVAD